MAITAYEILKSASTEHLKLAVAGKISAGFQPIGSLINLPDGRLAQVVAQDGSTSITAYEIVKSISSEHLGIAVDEMVAAGYQPFGTLVPLVDGGVAQAMIQGTPEAGGSVSAGDITDATAVGIAVLTADDAAAARTAIGAGTSSYQPSALVSALPADVGTNGQILKVQSDGTVAWAADTNTTYTTMTQAEATTGTATAGRVISAAVLATTINNKLAVAANAANGLTATETIQELADALATRIYALENPA